MHPPMTPFHFLNWWWWCNFYSTPNPTLSRIREGSHRTWAASLQSWSSEWRGWSRSHTATAATLESAAKPWAGGPRQTSPWCVLQSQIQLHFLKWQWNGFKECSQTKNRYAGPGQPPAICLKIYFSLACQLFLSPWEKYSPQAFLSEKQHKINGSAVLCHVYFGPEIEHVLSIGLFLLMSVGNFLCLQRRCDFSFLIFCH